MENAIEHVSDTALWVAHYRALESARPDALFRDPYAEVLAGKKGVEVARDMRATAKHVKWSVVTRTVVIDELILSHIAQGVDMVVNLGAGLDARPYRLPLPSTLPWIEVDYPHLIDYKESLLNKETPRCRLERVRLDLSDRARRRDLFANLAGRAKNILVLTEGVTPYLTEEQVGELCDDLRFHSSFRYWVTEFLSPRVYKYLKNSKRLRKMEKARFQFFPADWFGFFAEHGWRPTETKYLYIEAERVGRAMPVPWWSFVFLVFRPFVKKEKFEEFKRFTGYAVFQPTAPPSIGRRDN